MNKKTAQIDGRRVSLANLDKVFYPSYGLTKAHVLEYYRQVAPFILPHLKDRALTLKRYPDGAEGDPFFEKRCPSHRPAWVPTAEIPLAAGGMMTVCLVNDLNTLVWVENLASIELHVPLGRVGSPYIADSMVFDLDPGHPADILDAARVALILRGLLSELRLACFVKTSGKKGLHVYVPLNWKGTTFEQSKRFSKSMAEVLQRSYPDLVTAVMAKDLRKGKIFINWSQNDPSKTMVCVYSLRAGEVPSVSFPVEWHEVEDAAKQRDASKLQVTHAEAVRRLKKHGDLFRDVLTIKQKLPYLKQKNEQASEKWR